MTRNFKNIKRIVVKVGSSSLTNKNCEVDEDKIRSLVSQIMELKKRGFKVVLVSSGAVACGVGKLKPKKAVYTIPEKQAMAAVGQGILIHKYERVFAEYGLTIAQVLLTRGDFSSRQRFLYARNAVECLLNMDVIPIINENDTVSVDELKLGDNDRLSALVAVLIDADMLMMLTDIDGLYDRNPNDSNAKLISDVYSITEDIRFAAGNSSSSVGTGGMITKLQAAKIAGDSGVIMGIMKAYNPNILIRFISGEKIGTVFWPKSDSLKRKKRWIAFASDIRGKLIIDDGAKKALIFKGKSLLPSGIVEVCGRFDIGNTVSISGIDGEEVAKGIVNFSSEEIEKIKGNKTSEIEKILDYKYCDEVIHRNNMVVTKDLMNNKA